MAKRAIYEELDEAIEQLMDDATPRVAEELNELMSVAGELKTMPSVDFRERLQSDLQDHAMFIAAGRTYRRERGTSKVLQMPRPAVPMFATGEAMYPVNRTNFMLSVLLHTAALGLIVSSGAWFVKEHMAVVVHPVDSAEVSEYVMPVAPAASSGGGGGGDRDKVDAPKGRLPKQAREQITPPAMVLRNEHPVLAMEPTVVAPPVNIATNMPNLGDPMSRMPSGPPSNGVGSGGGIGSGIGGGVGTGMGPGVGPGYGGGIGGGVYRVGGGVSAPRVMYSPDPDYSEQARKAKYQGTVVLWVIVDSQGRVRDAKVARSLGMGLDEKAIEAVRKWKFEPAQKDGRPVAVQVYVEVNFRMF